MKERYIELLKYLKVTYENIFNLHHNIYSANYFADHEKMAEYYELIQKLTDDLIESGLTLDIKEPTIKESCESYEVYETKARSKDECYKIIFEDFNDIIGMMDNLKDTCPDWLKNKIEEYQYTLNIEANFKIARLLSA